MRFHRLTNESGFALVMIMVLSAISLSIMAGLIYMTTAGTQISGVQKRYSTASDANRGGLDLNYQFIETRGDAFPLTNLLTDLTIAGLLPDITTPAACRLDASKDFFVNSALKTENCSLLDPSGDFSGVAAKFLLPSDCWSVDCSRSLSIDPVDHSTYDLSMTLGVDPAYIVYSKIVDTIDGNTTGGSGLTKTPVVGTSDAEKHPMTIPYLYSLEMDTQRVDNPMERAKFSVLYQF